ncbi:phosphonate C-P lyase system protein PhnH [soil metagenome]
MTATVPSTRFDRTRRARMSPDESQQAFRALLDALARPGHVVVLPASLTDRMPPVLVPVAALADVEVSVAVLTDPADRWADAVLQATGARAAPLAQAQLVACRRAPEPAELASLERGDPDAPERGTRVSIACRSLRSSGVDGAGGPGVALTLRGPGVESATHVVVEGLRPEALAAMVEANHSFPAGIDAWLVADDGSVVGLPRSTRITVRPAPGPGAGPPTDPDHHDHDHQGAR